MPNLDIEFELSGLRLKIKGQTEDVSGKVAALQSQIQNLMGTISALAQNGATGQLPAPPIENHKVIEAPPAQLPEPNKRRNNTRKSGGAPRAPKADAIDFKFDAEKYGFPKQAWSSSQKALWLLYVLTDSGIATELTASAIAATFNKHFKTFGTILAHNVARDLAKEKGKSGAINSDATKNPETWYLLDAGKKQTAAFIASEAKAPATE